MLWMAVFHFDFDLNMLGFIQPRQHFFDDAFWTTQRTCILSLFLFAAGASLAVAMTRGQTWANFWRRWSQVAGCAVLVSIATWVMFPRGWIWFGVLHGLAVMLVVTRLVAPLKTWLVPLGAAVIVVLPLFKTHAMEATPVRWLGLGVDKPITQDWVPLVPWLGVMWIGFGLAHALYARRSSLLTGGVAPAMQPLVTLGQWSLAFYMLHQPIFLAMLHGVAKVTR